MVEQALRKLAPVDPTVLGDPAEAEEFHLAVLETAVALSDLGPAEADLELGDLALI